MKGSTFLKIEAVLPLEGEVSAAKLGVELAAKMGFRDIILEGDSAMAIKAIRQWTKRTEWRIHEKVSEIIYVCSLFDSWKVVHTYQGVNETVHSLARWASAEFSSSGNPGNTEHSLELPWVYAGTDPP